MLYVYLHRRSTFGAVFSSVALIIVSHVHMYIYVFTFFALWCSFYTVFTCFVSHAYSHYCTVRITSQILFVFHAGESHLVSELLLYSTLQVCIDFCFSILFVCGGGFRSLEKVPLPAIRGRV